MKIYHQSVAVLTLSSFLLCSCVHPNQSNYGDAEVGHDAVVMYGIVKSARKVDITGKNSGTGGTVGAAGGVVAASAIGNGRTGLAGLLAGAVIGGVAGAAAEQAMKDRQGIEYVIRFADTGDTRSIVQNIAKTDAPIAKGSCVMVQMSGTYQRVLPDDDMTDCPKPHKSKKHHVKTELTSDHQAATTLEHEE